MYVGSSLAGPGFQTKASQNREREIVNCRRLDSLVVSWEGAAKTSLQTRKPVVKEGKKRREKRRILKMEEPTSLLFPLAGLLLCKINGSKGRGGGKTSNVDPIGCVRYHSVL